MGKRCDSVNYRDIYKHEILFVNGKNKKILWFHFVEARQQNDDDSDKFKINKNTFLVSCDYEKQIHVVNGFLHASKIVDAEISNCVFPFISS